MTDKEAIKILEHLKKAFIVCDCEEIKYREAEAIDTILLSYETILNELDKKNKEIEELTIKLNMNEYYRDAMIPRETISKQTIQEIIKTAEKDIKNDIALDELLFDVLYYLKGLLKGEDE